MADILNITHLGRVEIVETYIYYDQPVLFSCRSASGNLYLAVAADETPEDETWLYVGVSIDRLKQIRSGEIDLHDAFADPEEGLLFQEIIPYGDETQPRMESIQPNQVPDDMFPIRGERLDLEPDTFLMLSDSAAMAKFERQEIVDLFFNFVGNYGEEAPIALLGNILKNFQAVMNVIGMSIANLNQINENIKSKMALSVSEIGSGSFGIRLVSGKFYKETFNVFDSDSGKAILEFLNLLKAKNNEPELTEILTRLQSRVAREYVRFLKSLSESVIDTRLTWTSPTPDRGGTISLSGKEIPELIEILERYQEEEALTHTIIGTLTGVFLRSKRFEIETAEEIYRGSIPDDPSDNIVNATISKIYKAYIQETTKQVKTTKEVVKQNTNFLI